MTVRIAWEPELVSHHPGATLLEAPPVIVVGSDRRSVTVQVAGSAPLTLLALISDSDRIEIVVSATSKPHLVG